jgi:hypothetical protein
LCDEVLKGKKYMKRDTHLPARSTFWPSVENMVRQIHQELCLKNLNLGDMGPL